MPAYVIICQRDVGAELPYSCSTLHEIIDVLPQSWQLAGSAWLVCSTLSASHLLAWLRPHVAPHDTLIVARLDSDIAWQGKPCAWLESLTKSIETE